MRAPSDVLNEIRRHGEETYPEECCGLLLGRQDGGENVVVTSRRVTNRNENRRVDRYVIAPEDYLEADRTGRRESLDIVGIYHSHPDHPAEPSRTDLEQAAFPGYTYVIVSVERASAAAMTAWSLAPDRSKFLPEPITETPPETISPPRPT